MTKELATQGKLQSPVPVGVVREILQALELTCFYECHKKNGRHPKESLLRMKMARTVTQRALEEMEAFHTETEGT